MREIPRAIIVFALAAVFVALSPIVHPQLPPTNSPKRGAIDRSKVMDLTYSFDESTIYWPTAKSFDWQKESWGTSPGGYWYASARYAASEHGGTHIDSPIHFGKDQATTDQIPLSRLIGPAVAIDISAACDKDPDYRLSVADIVLWERKHGSIPDGAIVLVHTGWGKFWSDRKRYPRRHHSSTLPGYFARGRGIPGDQAQDQWRWDRHSELGSRPVEGLHSSPDHQRREHLWPGERGQLRAGT